MFFCFQSNKLSINKKIDYEIYLNTLLHLHLLLKNTKPKPPIPSMKPIDIRDNETNIDNEWSDFLMGCCNRDEETSSSS